MPINKASLDQLTFIQGLITEASPLTYPENAAIALDNLELEKTGEIRRRLGFELESGSVSVDTTDQITSVDEEAINTFRWESVSNDVALIFGVVQVGNKLWFVDLQTTPISDNVKNSGVPFTIENPSTGSVSGKEVVAFTSLNGDLVIVSKELVKPLRISYNKTTDTISSSQIEVKVRDIWGIDDGYDIDERIKTYDNLYRYNLHNNGWPQHAIMSTNDYGGSDYAQGRYLPHHYFNVRGSFPAKSEKWFLGRGGGAGHTSNVSSWSPWTMKKFSPINTAFVDRGAFIIDVFNRGASRGENIYRFSTSNFPADVENGRMTSVATFSDRVFYSGIESDVTDGDANSPDYTGTIFFSKVVDSAKDMAQCYQDADPTDEYDSALVATDGGTIKLAGSGNIIKMVSIGSALVVVAVNGVWQIQGEEGAFAADNYSIKQITLTGCKSPNSVVVAEDSVVFWGEGGIFMLAGDEVSGKLRATNISENTIQSFYSAIPLAAKRHASGVFDPIQRKVRWLYNDDSAFDGVNYRFKYNRELVIDLVTSAFTTQTINESSDGRFLAGYLRSDSEGTVEYVYDIIHDGGSVEHNTTEVTYNSTLQRGGVSTISGIVIYPKATSGFDIGFGGYTNALFQDWGEADAPAFLETGYMVAGDAKVEKQVPYITMYFNQTETGFESVDGELEAVNASSCQTQARWDFANSTTSNKYGLLFEGYRLDRNYIPEEVIEDFDYGYKVVVTKTKLRGEGRALSLRMDTSSGKDLQLLGWSLDVTGKAA